MFNKALFKLEWKTNYKILIIFCLILTMYTTIMISMYDPELGSALEVFSKSMPEIMAMVGMSGTPDTLVDFITEYLYGFIMIVFPVGMDSVNDQMEMHIVCINVQCILHL